MNKRPRLALLGVLVGNALGMAPALAADPAPSRAPAQAAPTPAPAPPCAPPPPPSSGLQRKLALKLSQQHVALSVRAYEIGHYDVAAGEMQQAYTLTPQPDLLFNLAQACREGGHEREALVLYEQVVLLKADASVHSAAERHVRELRAQLARPEDERAQRLFDSRAYPEAAAAWEAAYQSNPAPLFLFRIAQAARLAGRTEQALATYRRFLQEDPRTELRKETEDQINRLLAHRDDERGAQHLQSRQYGQAIAAWQAAYQKDAAPIYLFRLAQAMRLAGLSAEALPMYERFLQEDPRTELQQETRGYIGQLRAQQADLRAQQAQQAGHYEEAAAAWELAYQQDQRPGRLFLLGEARRLAGLRQQALQAYRDFVSAAPRDPQRVTAQGHIHELQAQLDALHRKDDRRQHPIYRRWWFWGTIGVVAAGAAAGITAGVLTRGSLLPGVPPENQREVKP